MDALVQAHRTDIASLLEFAKRMDASDLHLTVGVPPTLRVHGKLVPVPGTQPLSRDEVHDMVYDVLTDAQKAKLEEHLDLDFSLELEGLGRFRVNVFFHRLGEGAVFRLIPSRIKSIEELGLPGVLEDLSMRERGLILVTGPTGSGKSTTLAAMVDLINQRRTAHIITLEDPIEFVYPRGLGVVNQREIGVHATSFAAGLRAALREDPDVILVGEMRDLETIALALTAAETGHLVLSTLHTGSAAQTVNRVIDVFPADQQEQVRVQLAESLVAVISQTLLPTSDGTGRVVACEVMVATPAVRNLIREGKVHQIPSAIQTGAKDGMQSLDQSLRHLLKTGRITAEVAYRWATDKESVVPTPAADAWGGWR
jgi:twitching motility protein PilT